MKEAPIPEADKEKIFYAYFDQRQDDLNDVLGEIGDFDEFSLKEKLQTLLETQLELFTPDREFVAMTFKALLDSPMKSFTELRPAKEKFAHTARAFFASAVEREEIPQQAFESFLVHLFWEYKNLVVLYWLRDDSAGFVNTSKLIDMTLDIYVEIVKSDMVTKCSDILLFLLKSHIYGNIDKLFELMALFSKGPGSVV